MRAYIKASTPSGSREMMGVSFTNFDGSTNIYNIEDQKSDNDDTIYDLSGRMVNAQLKKGLYIVNGKKVAVK